MKTINPTLLGLPGRRVKSAVWLSALLVAGAAFTQTTTRPLASPQPAVALKSDDRNFAEKIVRVGMDESAISAVAAERTSNPRVRSFAEKIVADHERMNAELTSLAAEKGVVLPAKDAVAEKWTKRDAKDFDVDYLQQMIADHEDAVKLFQRQARDGTDVELVAFARKYLSSLQHHLEQAVDLERSMK